LHRAKKGLLCHVQRRHLRQPGVAELCEPAKVESVFARAAGKHEAFAAKKDWENANLWAEQVWQYQVKTADLGLRAKTYLEQNGAKKVK